MEYHFWSYLSGMLSIRKLGYSLPDIIGDEMGHAVKTLMRALSLVLLILLTTTFLSGPATLLQGLCPLSTIHFHLSTIPIAWVLIIFGYYALATVLPVDKLIGRFYPIFGAMLLFMGIGIMVVMLGWHSAEMPEVFDGLHNRQTNGLPLFPMMFVSIACGAISGFHGTQSPIMARCVTNERQGRWIFYGAMVAEGILALIWAAAAGTFFADPEKGLYGIDGLQSFAAQHPGENIAALVIDKVRYDVTAELFGAPACTVVSGRQPLLATVNFSFYVARPDTIHRIDTVCVDPDYSGEETTLDTSYIRCDTVVITHNLVLRKSAHTFDTVAHDVAVINGVEYTTSQDGITWTVKNRAGCDSIITCIRMQRRNSRVSKPVNVCRSVASISTINWLYSQSTVY